VSDDLEATIEIAATPEQVWGVVADLRRMPEFSPLLVKMIVVGSLREGARTININRNGWKFYPTASKIVRLEPNRAIAWTGNGAVWSYTLEPTGSGTTLTERRELPNGLTVVGKAGLPVVFGNAENRDDILTAGMKATLAEIKSAIEAPN
jgi:hypothetical protein